MEPGHAMAPGHMHRHQNVLLDHPVFHDAKVCSVAKGFG